MPIKVDNSFSTSDALRRYNKANEKVTDDADGEEIARPAAEEAVEKRMDQVTLSEEAERLLAARGPGAPNKSYPEVLTYNARAKLAG